MSVQYLCNYVNLILCVQTRYMRIFYFIMLVQYNPVYFDNMREDFAYQLDNSG